MNGYEITPGVSPVHKDLAIGLASNGPLDPCCLVEVARWVPGTAGQQRTCPECHNVMKSVVVEGLAMSVARDPITAVAKPVMAPGFEIHAIAYDVRRWYEHKIEPDVEAMGLRKDATDEVQGIRLYGQRPISWFYPGTMRVVNLKAGVVAVVGKLQEAFAGVRPATNDLKVEIQKDSAVQHLR